MEINEIICRDLVSDDIYNYVRLCTKSDFLMQIPQTNLEKNNNRLGLFKLFDHPTSKRIGAFYNEKLIGTLSGYYVPGVPIWYLSNFCVDLDQLTPGLSLFKEVHLMLFKMIDPLILHGEALRCYSFYVRAEAKQQKINEKIRLRINNQITPENKHGYSYKMLQYNPHVEMVYKAGEKCHFNLHRFYFEQDRVYPVDTVISMHVLNAPQRKMLLGMS